TVIGAVADADGAVALFGDRELRDILPCVDVRKRHHEPLTVGRAVLLGGRRIGTGQRRRTLYEITPGIVERIEIRSVVDEIADRKLSLVLYEPESEIVLGDGDGARL